MQAIGHSAVRVYWVDQQACLSGSVGQLLLNIEIIIVIIFSDDNQIVMIFYNRDYQNTWLSW